MESDGSPGPHTPDASRTGPGRPPGPVVVEFSPTGACLHLHTFTPEGLPTYASRRARAAWAGEPPVPP